MAEGEELDIRRVCTVPTNCTFLVGSELNSSSCVLLLYRLKPYVKNMMSHLQRLYGYNLGGVLLHPVILGTGIVKDANRWRYRHAINA